MVNIHNLIVTGRMALGSGGGSTPTGHADTRFTLEGGTTESENITGTLDQQWFIDNGYYDESEGTWSKNITQADIGNTVTSIGDNAFLDCSGLTSVTIPDSVTSIGEYAFLNCIGLTSVTIGNGVTSIGTAAFSDCSSLTSVTIGNGVTSIGNSAFAGCSLTSVTIPDSVTSIGSSAFNRCRGLTGVTIPDNVTSIEESAFEDCDNLLTVTIGSGVTSVGRDAFSGCIGLTSMTFNSFTKNQVKTMTTGYWILGGFYDPDTEEPMAKTITAICTDGSMTINFSADDPATITFTDL